jgi:hypothetical protein
VRTVGRHDGRPERSRRRVYFPPGAYQFYFSQPIVFPGYASAASSIASAQLLTVQGGWATIQYNAGPNKNTYTVAINSDHLVAIHRLP